MSYKVTRLANKPIIVVDLASPFDFIQDVAPLYAEIAQIRQQIPGRAYCIYDITDLDLTFSDLVMGLAAASREHSPGAPSDPTTETIAVATDEFVRSGIEALKQPQYGQINVKMYSKLDEAIRYAEAQAAKLSG